MRYFPGSGMHRFVWNFQTFTTCTATLYSTGTVTHYCSICNCRHDKRRAQRQRQGKHTNAVRRLFNVIFSMLTILKAEFAAWTLSNFPILFKLFGDYPLAATPLNFKQVHVTVFPTPGCLHLFLKMASKRRRHDDGGSDVAAATTTYNSVAHVLHFWFQRKKHYPASAATHMFCCCVQDRSTVEKIVHLLSDPRCTLQLGLPYLVPRIVRS